MLTSVIGDLADPKGTSVFLIPKPTSGGTGAGGCFGEAFPVPLSKTAQPGGKLFPGSLVSLWFSGDWTDSMCWRGVGIFTMPLGIWL